MNESKNNQILAALPAEDYRCLCNSLQLVQLSLKEILIKTERQVETLYFPTQGIVSIVSTMQNGSTTGVELIGKEGIVMP